MPPDFSLSVNIIANLSRYWIGDEIIYTIIVTNSNQDTAQSVTIYNPLPVGLSDMEYSLDDGYNWLPWNGSYVIGSLLANTSFTILLRAIVNRHDTCCIIDTAYVTATSLSGEFSFAFDTEISRFCQEASLSVTNFLPPEPIFSCTPITFYLIIQNFGPSVAENVVIVDDFSPIATQLMYSIDNGMTWNAWNGVYTLGTLNPEDTVFLQVTGIVRSMEKNILCNTATLYSSTIITGVNNSSTIYVPIHSKYLKR